MTHPQNKAITSWLFFSAVTISLVYVSAPFGLVLFFAAASVFSLAAWWLTFKI